MRSLTWPSPLSPSKSRVTVAAWAAVAARQSPALRAASVVFTAGWVSRSGEAAPPLALPGDTGAAFPPSVRKSPAPRPAPHFPTLLAFGELSLPVKGGKRPCLRHDPGSNG